MSAKWLAASSALVVLALSPMRAAEPEFHVPQVRLPLMAPAPVIDGEVKADEWAGAARMERFGWAGALAPQEASFWVGCDGRDLFVAVVSETPPGGRLVANVEPLAENGDARTLDDDGVELVLDPLRSDTGGRRRLYHAILNAKGAIYDTAYLPDGTGEAWRGHWRLASKIIGDRWHFEAALPLADLKVTADDLARPFGVRVCRQWRQSVAAAGCNQTEWGAIAGRFLNPDTIPTVTWDEKAPVVQLLQLHDPGKSAVRLRLAIRNPHAAPLEVRALLTCTPKSSAPTTLDRIVKLAPKSAETVELSGTAAADETTVATVSVTAAAGTPVYYFRDFAWKTARPEPLWTLNPDTAKKVDIKVAYYPYHNTIKTVLNITGLPERDKVTGAILSVRAKGKANVLAKTRLTPLRNYAGEMEWKIPELKDGVYEFVAELKGVNAEPTVTEFVRHVFPWEHNRLGKSDVVIEPFTPIQVRGRQVDTVLRHHTLNDLGLFDQIESLGQPLLAAAMRLEVNGIAATGTSFKFTGQTPTRVGTKSAWKAGPVTGTAAGAWDYDGMMTWALELPAAKPPITSMTLVIPFVDRRVPLFHACTDGIRFNHAGNTPTGQGRVWDGSKAARNEIVGSYVPYLWLGAEERGLAVFGENDRGWVRDPKSPCQELVRNGDTLELRLNLIAAPVKLEQPRRIVIGFQATPVKPLPAGWRTWQSASGQGSDKGVEMNWSWLGACYYWGGLTMAADLYPRNADYRIYEKFAETRRTGRIDQEFVKQWLDGYPDSVHVAANNEWGLAFENLYPPHVKGGFGIMSTRPQRVVAYTNSRGVLFTTPEGQTFVDEWHRDAFNPHVKAVYYDVNDVESFRDFAVWNYNKMFDTWLDDVYWDNIFLVSCFDTVGTDAYRLPDGKIQPATGLFETRELIRRTAVLNHERGKRAWNMAHMTNTAIVPILAFCGSQLSWEDRAGDRDCQDRFSRDYIRAESLGRQAGNVPFVLIIGNLNLQQPKDAWIVRTFAGVMLTHELKPQGAPNYPPYWSNFLRLLEFGYGKPEIRVWNYWDEDCPVRIAGGETSSLVLSKPGQALVVVCDYGSGGDLTLKPASALGLGQKIRAKDVESGQALSVADGAVRFNLPKHDFKMVRIENGQ